MIKTLKKTFMLLLAITTFITSVPIANAKAVVEYENEAIAIIKETQSGGGGKNDTCNSARKYCADHNENGVKRSYVATYRYTFTDPEVTTITVYDMEDTDIINSDMSISKDRLPLSGTAIGLNVHEKKRVIVALKSVTINVYNQSETKKETVEQYVCKYEGKTFKPIINEFTKIEPIKIDDGMCQYTEIVPSATTECPVYSLCKSTIEKEGKGYPEVEYVEQEFIEKQPDRKIKIDLTTVDANGKFVPVTTQITSGIDVDEIDFKYVTEAIEHAADKFFNNLAYNIHEYKASYNISISNSNDINDTIGVTLSQSNATATAIFHDINGNVINCKGWKNGCEWQYTPGTIVGDTYYVGGVSAPGALFDIREIDMYYRMDRTCINVKTGEVSYKLGNNKCGKDEFEISNTNIAGDEHWHYFIPLNAKSAEGVTVQMQPAIHASPLNVSTRLNALKDYYIIKEDSTETPSNKSPYYNVIKPNSSEMFFKGDYYCVENCGTDKAIFNDNSSDYTNIINNGGCYKRHTISIPVQQLFYNETSSNTLNGFNFYYKPIDVSSAETDNQIDIIFPNGVSKDWLGNIKTTTLWDDWYKAQTDPTASNESKMPDLSKSYDNINITYIAQDINAKQIREYTETHPYTNWLNMNLNGTSSFIGTTEGVVTRVGDPTKNIYKLGCGPANSFEYYDEAKTIKNTLYIKGCELK